MNKTIEIKDLDLEIEKQKEWVKKRKLIGYINRNGIKISLENLKNAQLIGKVLLIKYPNKNYQSQQKVKVYDDICWQGFEDAGADVDVFIINDAFEYTPLLEHIAAKYPKVDKPFSSIKVKNDLIAEVNSIKCIKSWTLYDVSNIVAVGPAWAVILSCEGENADFDLAFCVQGNIRNSMDALTIDIYNEISKKHYVFIHEWDKEGFKMAYYFFDSNGGNVDENKSYTFLFENLNFDITNVAVIEMQKARSSSSTGSVVGGTAVKADVTFAD